MRLQSTNLHLQQPPSLVTTQDIPINKIIHLIDRGSINNKRTKFKNTI